MTRQPAATLLGKNVRRLCDLQGLSLGALVARLDWPTETLGALEAGTLDATLDQIDQLCAALGTTPLDLFDTAETSENQAPERRYG